MEDFSQWLNEELDQRGWSRSEAARRGGPGGSPSMWDQVILGTAKPGPKFCRSVSRAFGVPFEEVQRRAGLLPAYTELPDEAKAWGRRLLALTPERRQLALRSMEDVLRVFEQLPRQ